MKRLLVIMFTICGSLLGPATTCAQETYSLQYKFEKGKVYRFGDTVTVNSTSEMMGQEMKSTSRSLSVTRAVVDDIQSDGATVFVMSSDTMSVAVKSTRGDTLIVPKEMIGKRTRVTVSRLGKVSNRETIDTIKLTGTIRLVGQRETMRFHAFSSKPVKLGEKWTSTRSDTSDAMGGKTVVVSTVEYTLAAKSKKAGKECLEIDFAGKMSITGKGSMMGMEIFVEGSGTTSGAVFVDPKTGLPLLEESKTEMETTAALTGQQNMTIPSSQSVISHRGLLGE